MDYLIATIVIMLFCITALAQERHPDSIMLISRPKPKPIRHGKVRAKHVAKYNGVVSVITGRPELEAGINPRFFPGRQQGQGLGLVPVYAGSNSSFCTAQAVCIPKPSFMHTLSMAIGVWSTCAQYLLLNLLTPRLRKPE